MSPIIWVIILLVNMAIFFAVGYFASQYVMKVKMKSAEEMAQDVLDKAEAERKNILLKAKEESIKVLESAEAEAKKRRAELQQQDERLQKRQENLEQRFESIDRRERNLNKRQSAVDRRANELQKMHEKRVAELERIAGLTSDEARELLLETVREDSRQELARVIREVEAEAKQEADKRAREITTLAIQRIASEQVSEITVSSVLLPNDDMKGRIIGRQGRNIRAFENATGIDVVVDDTPEAIILSGFDPVRREVARVAMTKLLTDGRIHPARIEKVVSKAREEVNQVVKEEGERAAFEAGVHGLHPEIIKLLGRLKFRSSYGQNQHTHAIETSLIAGMLAAELGADVRVAKEAGLLHDIGKAVDHEVEGPHALIGADIAKRYGVNQKVVNCISAHHHEAEQESMEAILVEAADAISGARPGARRESLENYVKRIKALEEAANAFEGVAETYAIQAGREIRILVKPEDIDDYGAINLSKEIARKVEETFEYPGQIKITVIRETRAVDYAK